MRRNVNQNVFNDMKNVSATTPLKHAMFPCSALVAKQNVNICFSRYHVDDPRFSKFQPGVIR